MQLLYRTRYRFRLLPNRILSALYSNISMLERSLRGRDLAVTLF